MQCLRGSPAFHPTGVQPGQGSEGGTPPWDTSGARSSVLICAECCVTLGRSDGLSGPLGDTLHRGGQTPDVPKKYDVSPPFTPPMYRGESRTRRHPAQQTPGSEVRWVLRADMALMGASGSTQNHALMAPSSHPNPGHGAHHPPGAEANRDPPQRSWPCIPVPGQHAGGARVASPTSQRERLGRRPPAGTGTWMGPSSHRGLFCFPFCMCN